MRRKNVRVVPGTVGWAGVLAVVVTTDWVASRQGKPTMSKVVAEAGDHPILGPVTVGVAAGLCWHLFAWPILQKVGG